MGDGMGWDGMGWIGRRLSAADDGGGTTPTKTPATPDDGDHSRRVSRGPRTPLGGRRATSCVHHATSEQSLAASGDSGRTKYTHRPASRARRTVISEKGGRQLRRFCNSFGASPPSRGSVTRPSPTTPRHNGDAKAMTAPIATSYAKKTPTPRKVALKHARRLAKESRNSCRQRRNIMGCRGAAAPIATSYTRKTPAPEKIASEHVHHLEEESRDSG